MAYASLLVHVETGSTSCEARLDLAASLAARFNAALIGIAAGAVRPSLVDTFGGALLAGELLAAGEEQIRAELQAAEDQFRLHPGVRALPTEWRAAIDMPAEVLARESRSADLVIVGRDLERVHARTYWTADPGEVVMASGRPVLVVPPGADSLLARRIVVGWKDARETRRAIWDASPFLRAAASVHVVEVSDEAEIEEATARVADVVRHLERHQVKAHGEVRTPPEGSTADELLLVAEQHGADLIVAGGYGHARFRECVFGGVTQELLRHCPKCCLFSH